MIYSEPARTTTRRRSTILFVLIVLSLAVIGVGASPIDFRHSGPVVAVIGTNSNQPTMEDPGQRQDHEQPKQPDMAMLPGEADGVVPGGVTVFDDEFPAVANLDPDLIGALRQAALDAGGDDVTFYVNSGWRSPEYQEQLLREAVSEYGSEKEAARWVASSETSAHVSGDAVDLGPSDATAWLSQYGAGYGLCQIYSNEPWHYELHPEAIDQGCPPMYADPTEDPRMQG